MTLRELNCAVARRTGEDLSEIRRRGFSIANPQEIRFDPEPDQLVPQMIDWDDDARGSIPIPGRCGTQRRSTRRLHAAR